MESDVLLLSKVRNLLKIGLFHWKSASLTENRPPSLKIGLSHSSRPIRNQFCDWGQGVREAEVWERPRCERGRISVKEADFQQNGTSASLTKSCDLSQMCHKSFDFLLDRVALDTCHITSERRMLSKPQVKNIPPADIYTWSKSRMKSRI